jgi:adenylate cyclase
MRVAERVYSQAQEQDDPALKMWAYNALATTHYFLGDFASARQHATDGLQIWRMGDSRFHLKDFDPPIIGCLCYKAFSEWHLGEIASCQAKLDEAISLAKELNDMHALAVALGWATGLAEIEHDPAKVDRLASDLIELSTRHNFAYWLAEGGIHRGWARSASGDTAQGIPWIEQGIRDFRATGTVLVLPYYLGLKAEALHLADRDPEALEAIEEAEKMVEQTEERQWCAELRRLRGIFLASIGADEAQIEASFLDALRIAKEQTSISLEERAERTYAEYCRQKTIGVVRRGFRLPLF